MSHQWSDSVLITHLSLLLLIHFSPPGFLAYWLRESGVEKEYNGKNHFFSIFVAPDLSKLEKGRASFRIASHRRGSRVEKPSKLIGMMTGSELGALNTRSPAAWASAKWCGGKKAKQTLLLLLAGGPLLSRKSGNCCQKNIIMFPLTQKVGGGGELRLTM